MEESVFTEDFLCDDEDFVNVDAGSSLMIDIASSHLSERGELLDARNAVTSFTHLKRFPSFSQPSCSSVMQSVIIIVDRPGPLLMQLKMHPSRKCVILHGFDRDEDGDRGELELSGKLQPGDLLIDINGKSLERKSFKEVLRLIRQEGMSGGPRVLSLVRFTSPESEADYFSTEGATLKDSGCYPSSEVAEDVGIYIRSLLDRENIDMIRLRRVSAQGLPPVDGLRALVWMVLLGYLPEQRALWEVSLDKNRNLYNNLKTEFKICPTHTTEVMQEVDLVQALPPEDGGGIWRLDTDDKEPESGRKPVDDNPLQTDRDKSHWARYFEDRELLESVEKDVIRTYPEHSFFDDKAKLALKAILFIYAKLNPGVSYVQGMNELVGTLYFVFATNTSFGSWSENAEADTFFCFTALMSEFQDLFIHRLDDTSRGLQGTIERYCQLMAAEDPFLDQELQKNGLEATFYTVRWLTTLFSREFDLSDTIRLWDSLFADTDKHEFLSFMCFTMATEQRDFIFTNDFADSLKMLQSYPLKDVPHLLEVLEATRSAVCANKPRTFPGHPLNPSATVPGRSNNGISYLSAAGRQMLYQQLRNVDTSAMKATSYELLSNSVNKIMSSAGTALEAFDNRYSNAAPEENNQNIESEASSPRTSDNNTIVASVHAEQPEGTTSASDVVRATQETASIAGRWAWQGLVSLASQASIHISRNLNPEEENISTPIETLSTDSI